MPSDNRDIQAVIRAGESERVEFKKVFDRVVWCWLGSKIRAGLPV